MAWHLQYTPLIWPMLTAGATLAALGLYIWRRHPNPRARPLAILAFVGVAWAAGAAMELASVEMPTRVFWFKFHTVWELPAATVALWFALDYADFGCRVRERTLKLLAAPPIIVLLLILIDGRYHVMWSAIWFDPQVHGDPTFLYLVVFFYGTLISVATVLVFLWLALHYPLHRPAVALCLAALLVWRGAYSMDRTHLPFAAANPLAPLDLTVLTFPLVAALFALALFRFRLLEVIPVARGSIIEHMQEGMVVLNPTGHVLDINPAAETMLGITGGNARGQRLSQVLPDYPALAEGHETEPTDVRFLLGNVAHQYSVHHSPLSHRHGAEIGTLLLLCDVSREREMQARLLEQQRAVATLKERDRVARELHDSLGQVLGYVKMQAQAARGFLAQACEREANGCLEKLVAAAQEAHLDVRDYIHGARAGVLGDSSFIQTLEHYLRRYTAVYGIEARLEVDSSLGDHAFEPTVASQLLRILQEALSNARKHAHPKAVSVRLALSEPGWAEAVVQDDGPGFDADASVGDGFGVRFMHERAQEMGASLSIRSVPGQGAEVVVKVPLRKEVHESLAG